jgi:8-oxo-dGTP diphosphatase
MRREYPEAPIVTVGMIVQRGDRVLIAQRGNAPNRGRWSIPGGAVEVGETLREAGQREVREECGIETSAGDLADYFEQIFHDDAGRTRFHYVVFDFLAEYVSGDLRPGSDVMDARWATREELGPLDITEKARDLLLKVMG